MPFKHVLEWFDWNDNWSCFLIYASEIHWRVQTTVARRSGRFKEIHLALRTLHMSLYDDHTRRPSDPQTHNVGRTGHSFNSDTGDWWLLTNQRQKASLWLQVLPASKDWLLAVPVASCDLQAPVCKHAPGRFTGHQFCCCYRRHFKGMNPPMCRPRKNLWAFVVATAIVRTSEAYPAGWQGGKPPLWDVTVVSTLAVSCVSATAACPAQVQPPSWHQSAKQKNTPTFPGLNVFSP